MTVFRQNLYVETHKAAAISRVWRADGKEVFYMAAKRSGRRYPAEGRSRLPLGR